MTPKSTLFGPKMTKLSFDLGYPPPPPLKPTRTDPAKLPEVFDLRPPKTTPQTPKSDVFDPIDLKSEVFDRIDLKK